MTHWQPWLVKACGTEAAYRRHLRHGEKPCPQCLNAKSAASHYRKHRPRKRTAAR
jgi:hypothetical protein